MNYEEKSMEKLTENQFKEKYLHNNRYGIFHSEILPNGNIEVTLIDYVSEWYNELFTIEVEPEEKGDVQ